MAERKLESQLERLSAMALPELRSEWRRVYRTPAPNLGADLLARGIAWRLQEKRYGGLPPAVERMLVRLADEAPVAEPRQPAIALRPGTRLVRSWKEETWTVLVTEEGYLFQDKVWSSLTGIARAITGARWSGPRFFGLSGGARG